ncbi:MAG: PRC-barrel domain-containing protein [Sphingosinicella sp.]|nr:PRC-barrel domain-containing protein [Sphingosinicella sp.]
MRGGQWSWNRVPTGKAAAVAGAAAAVAGAALAASYFRSGRRSNGRAEDDFELRLETDENLRLISSAKVEGTPVIDRDGARMGTISNFMVDKYTGRVGYAVMKFGGGISGALPSFGANLFPLPWPVLDYDEKEGGYMLDIAKEDMADAPRFEASAEPEFGPEYRREILAFYRPSGNGSSGRSNAFSSRSTASSDSQPMASPTPTSVG